MQFRVHDSDQLLEREKLLLHPRLVAEEVLFLEEQG